MSSLEERKNSLCIKIYSDWRCKPFLPFTHKGLGEMDDNKAEICRPLDDKAYQAGGQRDRLSSWCLFLAKLYSTSQANEERFASDGSLISSIAAVGAKMKWNKRQGN